MLVRKNINCSTATITLKMVSETDMAFLLWLMSMNRRLTTKIVFTRGPTGNQPSTRIVPASHIGNW
jgi:hypothetical protein